MSKMYTEDTRTNDIIQAQNGLSPAMFKAWRIIYERSKLSAWRYYNIQHSNYIRLPKTRVKWRDNVDKIENQTIEIMQLKRRITQLEAQLSKKDIAELCDASVEHPPQLFSTTSDTTV